MSWLVGSRVQIHVITGMITFFVLSMCCVLVIFGDVGVLGSFRVVASSNLSLDLTK